MVKTALFGAAVVATLLLSGCVTAVPPRDPHAALLTPTAPEVNVQAPALFHVRMQTTQGEMLILVHRDWSPHGADRFYNLVRAGYYDHAKIFRISPRKWAQFGVNADPAVSTAWRTANIPDDPRVVSNTRGTISFAFAVPNGRTTQMFFNLADNSATHDGEPFVPFAEVISGMEAADRFYSAYGEQAGGGIRAGKQDVLFKEGNAWLEKNFPKLDEISKATVEP